MTRQDGFSAALVDPALPHPAGLTGRGGTPAGRRFDVYRNNVVSGLIDALETGFPVVRALVGEAFFKAMAAEFVRAHPPRTPRLMFYGADLPGFLVRFAPVAHLGYLPDVARLELALRESYHAADATPLPPEALGTLSPDTLARARLTVAPSLRILRSDWPIRSIWQAHHGGPAPGGGPEDVLVARPGYDPAPHPVPRGGYAMIRALIAGRTIGEAAEAAQSDHHDSNIPGCVGLLLSTQVLTGILSGDIP